MKKKILMILTVLAMCLAINGVAMAAEPAVVAVEGSSSGSGFSGVYCGEYS